MRIFRGLSDFVQLGTGAVSRAFRDVFREKIRVTDFGAIGDDSTDNATAIQAAYDALPASGGELIFPGNNRIYRTSAALTITKSNVILRGEDPSAVIKYTGGATTYILGDNGDTTTRYFNIEIKNLSIRGNANVQYGIQISSMHHSKFTGLRIQDVASTGLYVKFAVGNLYDIRVSNNDCPTGVFTVTPVVGIDFAGWDASHAATGSKAYLVVESCSGSGIKLGHTHYMKLSGFAEFCNRGLEVYQNTFNLTVNAMDFESNSTEDVLLNGCYYSEFNTINSSNLFNFALGRLVRLNGGQYNGITIDANGRNCLLANLVYVGTLTDGNAAETVRFNIVQFAGSPGVFTPYTKFYGDDWDLNNRQGSATTAYIRNSAAQAGADLLQFTDSTRSTIYGRVFSSGGYRAGRTDQGNITLQAGADATHAGYVEWLINGTRYGYMGSDTSASVALHLENGAKFAINNTGHFSKTISNTSTWDPPSINNGAQASTTVGVTGAAFGDTVLASLDRDLQGMQITAFVQSAGNVTVILKNDSGSTVDLVSSTLRIDVWQH